MFNHSFKLLIAKKYITIEIVCCKCELPPKLVVSLKSDPNCNIFSCFFFFFIQFRIRGAKLLNIQSLTASFIPVQDLCNNVVIFSVFLYKQPGLQNLQFWMSNCSINHEKRNEMRSNVQARREWLLLQVGKQVVIHPQDACDGNHEEDNVQCLS